MKQRMNIAAVAPGGFQAMLGLEKYLHECGLEEKLIHLIKLRASQLNGCAYCIDMHWKDARALGETEQRLYGLDAWEESPYYTERERAALLWTESVTGRPDTGRRHHQRVEPDRHLQPHGPRRIHTGGALSEELLSLTVWMNARFSTNTESSATEKRLGMNR
jgi:AhpD family alkylhydroperoxidase